MDIRLVCSDIDGTLLQYGKKELEGEIFEQIRALHQRGIWFCPASGRQYTSLRKLFAPVADCCVFICENGGTIFQEEQCIAKNPMPVALFKKIDEMGGIHPGYTPLLGYTVNHRELQPLLTYLQDNLHLDAPLVRQIGCVIGTHTGPGAFGIAFFDKELTLE